MKKLLACVALVSLSACNDSPGVAKMDFRRAPPVGVTGGTWVAKFSGQTVSDAELNQRFAEMNPYARARFQTVSSAVTTSMAWCASSCSRKKR